MGTLHWCQLFSEPGAGSDLASLSTRAVPVEGGWSLTGQKVWTSMARDADWGICLARTDPSAPKHLGITYFIVAMDSAGLDIRPLRELTGAAMFNEVFFDEVFVPDGCVIGEVNGGWGLARLTLANERVSMSSGSTFGIGVESLLRLADRLGGSLSPALAVRLGHLLAEAQSLRLMTHRSTLLALAGRTRARRPACASCSGPSTNSGSRSWDWPCWDRRGPPWRARPTGGPRGFWPPAA